MDIGDCRRPVLVEEFLMIRGFQDVNDEETSADDAIALAVDTVYKRDTIDDLLSVQYGCRLIGQCRTPSSLEQI
jgi:hypothetical protein